MNRDLTIIIPAYNEEASLEKFLPEVIDHCVKNNYKLIVVNDGSKDQTLQVLEYYASEHSVLEIVSHKVNRGYGGAIKSGINACETDCLITIDADGQHYLEDVDRLYHELIERDADMIVGNRGLHSSGYYRTFGKWLIRQIARMLMPLKIHDINSGLKVYNTGLAQKYIPLCPDSMAFSDVITLTFIYKRNLVLELPVRINQRIAGHSTIGVRTAFDTVMEIINIVVLFNPMRIFLPLSIVFIISSCIWELPILLKGNGVSIGAMLGFITGLIFFLLGLIAEQLGNLRRIAINNYNHTVNAKQYERNA